MAGQQLVQMPDGKLQVLTTTQIQQATKSQQQQQQQTVVTAKTPVIKTSASTVAPAGKLVLQSVAGQQVKQPQSPIKQQILIKQQGTPVLQKIASPGGTVVVSGGQVLQQQVVVSQPSTQQQV